MKLDDLRLFVHVVKYGSFSAASRALDVPAATLTRRIQHLERDLDVQLLVRNARGLSLTNAGNVIWRKSNEAIFDLEDLSTEIKDDIHEMEGVISIAAPAVFINEVLSPMLYPFLRKHPKVRMDFISDYEDDCSSRIFVEESVDIAFRFGEQKDSSLIARRLDGLEMGLAATPDYFKRRGEPEHPDELLKHDLIGYRGFSDIEFTNDSGETCLVRTQPKIQGSDPEILYQAALAGFGILPIPTKWYSEELEQGTLQLVLDDWNGPDCDIFLVYTSSNYLPRRVRSLIDYIFEQWHLQTLSSDTANNLVSLLK